MVARPFLLKKKIFKLCSLNLNHERIIHLGLIQCPAFKDYFTDATVPSCIRSKTTNLNKNKTRHKLYSSCSITLRTRSPRSAVRSPCRRATAAWRPRPSSTWQSCPPFRPRCWPIWKFTNRLDSLPDKILLTVIVDHSLRLFPHSPFSCHKISDKSYLASNWTVFCNSKELRDTNTGSAISAVLAAQNSK